MKLQVKDFLEKFVKSHLDVHELSVVVRGHGVEYFLNRDAIRENALRPDIANAYIYCIEPGITIADRVLYIFAAEKFEEIPKIYIERNQDNPVQLDHIKIPDVLVLDSIKTPTIDEMLITAQSHYTQCGIQPIELMEKNFSREEYRGYLNGNILKYILRYKNKNGIEDLRKASTYLSWLIDFELKGLVE